MLYFTGCALDIRERPATYICEAAAWGSLPWDLRSIALYHTSSAQVADGMARCLVSVAMQSSQRPLYMYSRPALTYAPENERIQQNVSFFKQSLSEARTE